MKEFGSDFHKCDLNFRVDNFQLEFLGCKRFFSCGRHAIEAIIKHEKWKRIWMPAYFCYEVIAHIKSTGIRVALYDDHPLSENDDAVVRTLPYQNGDVLFRTDYFGLRKWRSNKGIKVPVIEDHTHGLITQWTLRSDADWCIASLRKSFPIATGGVLWSPKDKTLPDLIEPTEECKVMAVERYKAMKMKAEYLKVVYATNTEETEMKETFREKYVDTEEQIANLTLSGIDEQSWDIINTFNIKGWTDLKFDNWLLAKDLLSRNFQLLEGERKDDRYPFSLILLLDTNKEREALRQYLVKNKIYPAVLWNIPKDSRFDQARFFSERMLSIHCDIRYSRKDIIEMCNTINKFYDTNI